MKTNEKRNGGFTMLEALAVTAILVILLGAGFVEIVRASNTLKVTELDNMARAIYMAANSRAVSLSRSGRLASVVDEATDWDSATGKPVQLVADTDTSKLRYIRYAPAPGDLLADLLPKETIDPKLRDGCFYIVYETYAGCVTDVFYAEIEKKETLSDANNMDKAMGNMEFLGDYSNNFAGFYGKWMETGADTSHSRRIDAKAYVGYYGGGLASAAICPKINQLPDPVIEIINGEELVLKITYACSETPALTAKLTCGGRTVTLPDNPMVTYLEFGKATKTWVLDTLKPEHGLLKKRFKDWGWPNGTVFGGDFTVSATLTKAGWKDGTADPKSDNSLFATYSGGETAYIANVRHLQNLDEKFHIITNDAANRAKTGKKHAVQTQEIDISTSMYRHESGIGLYSFQPIRNENLTSYDGGGYKIKYLEVKSVRDGGSAAGLFASVDVAGTFQFKNMRLVNMNVDVASAAYAGALAGMAGANSSMEIKNCWVYCEDLTAADRNAPFSYKINAFGSNAGGLVGEMKGGGTVKNSFAATYVAGGDVGGLIGVGNKNISIQNSYADCYLETTKTAANTGAVGGLVGRFYRGTSSMANVYAAGFIKTHYDAGGLTSAIMYDSSASVSVRNAYSAIHYVDRTGPIGGKNFNGVTNYYSVGYTDRNSTQNTYVQMKELAGMLGPAFVAGKAAATGGANPYNIRHAWRLTPESAEYPLLTDYELPGLAGLPHYGDWRASDALLR